MFQSLRGPLTVVSRLLLCTIFFMSAVGNKIPHFSDVAKIIFENDGVGHVLVADKGRFLLQRPSCHLEYDGGPSLDEIHARLGSAVCLV